MTTQTKKQIKETFEYKAEMKQLLQLIAHSLYTHPEVFIRELVSNSSDALNKIRFKKLTEKNVYQPDKELRIDINIDEEKQTFSISDTGIGMTKENLINQLGTVAKSGTSEFLEQLKKGKQKADGNLIGQFGVGFYSVYMVTDKISVKTRNFEEGAEGYKWTSKGDEKFEITEAKKADRGTQIYFKLKDEYKEFATESRVRAILKKYSNFIEYPIYLNGEEINTVDAIWQKSKSEITQDEANEFYKFISNDYQDPFDYIHLDLEGVVSFKALVFFPQKAPMNMFAEDFRTTLHLYTNKVFIQDNADWLLPDYLRFCKGVIDTSDLPLNVSREVTQHSPVMAKIKSILTGKILGEFDSWAKNDVEKFNTFYKEFGTMLKTGLNSDFSNRDRISKLLRFQSSNRDELISFDQYLELSDKEIKKIYYLSAENIESAKRNPNLEYFKKNNIEVIFLTDPIDSFVIPQLYQYEEHQLISIDKEEIDNEESTEKDENKEADKLVAAIKEILGDKVSDVKESKRLVDSPCTIVAGKDGMDAQTERMMKMMDKNFEGAKKVFEVNMNHKILKNLTSYFEKNGADDKFNNIVEQLYGSALLIEGELKNPTDYVAKVYDLIEAHTN
ncbi:MAG: molecular chaperone HtpG [Ignavibacteriae bacterium HGW-Ignavibacteriae-4]|jgi:molecular chaperone HtpG|nr:MAG: molecular chaperone HtpG [Ignavibacteriae bacterium HGW-Ignavibacteriae-4]